MQSRYLEILDFTQFFDHFVFTPNAENVLEKELKKKGCVIEVHNEDGILMKATRNPLDRMASEYLANATRLASELGITPASASRVKVEGRKEEGDEFDKFMRNFGDGEK